MSSTNPSPNANNPECPCPGPKALPLLRVAYPNENRSHVQVRPVIGTPGVDPCCKPSPCPDFDESLNTCQQVACTAGANDTTQPGSCYDATSVHQRQCECPKCICELNKFNDEGGVCYQHTEGNQFQPIRGPHPDPEVQAIYDRLKSSEGVRNNFRWCNTDESLTCVDRRFRQAPVGLTGQAWIHYGAAQDVDYPKKLIHGNLNDSSTPAATIVNPPPKNYVNQVMLDMSESIYESNRLRPIGKSHDQKERLPPHVDPEETAFGKLTDKSINAALLVNPPKSRFEVEDEGKEFKPMYKYTHGDYDAGEQMCRNYVGGFGRQNTFGIHTPHDNAGRVAKKIISSWRSKEPDPVYVNKIYADHLDFRFPKLGKELDPTCVKRDRGEQYIYGKPSAMLTQNDQRPVGEIIYNRCPNVGANKAQKIMSNLKTWIEKVRKVCKEERGPDMEKFYEEIIYADPACDGTVTWDAFINALKAHRVPRTMEERDFMEALAYVEIFHPAPCDKIDYYKLMDYLKSYEEPMFGCKTTTLKPWYCPHTNGSIHFRTTYSDLCSNMCTRPNCMQIEKEQTVHGMPSIRKDRLPAKIRSTKDSYNYGDDGDAYSLIWPSVYTVQGITIRDAFKEMTKDQIAKIFCIAQIPLTMEQLNRTYEAAKCLDPEGKERVSYQTFREALCQVCDEMAIESNCPPVFSVYPKDCPPFYPLKDKGKPNPCSGVDP